MASTNIYRATDATAASGYSQKWTWSGWVKRSGISSEQGIFSNERTDNHVNSRFKLRFIASDKITWECKDSGGSDDSSLVTNAVFRDTSGWCHICFVYDTDNGTAADRLILYVNGVRQTLSEENQASSGFGTLWSSAMIHQVGRYDDNSGNSKYFNGSMSHIHLSYGYALAPTVFGETDSTTGEWKIITSPSVTYGSQGYFILKDGNSLTDQSGESNDFTLSGGTLTNTEDNPSDVFATWNPLAAHTSSTPTFANGNTSVIGVDTSAQSVSSTLAMPSKGKYYCEMKLTQEANSTSSIPNFGIVDAASLFLVRNQELNVYSGAVNSYVGVVNSTTLYADGSSSGTTLNDTPDVGDIIGLAVDLDTAQNTLKYYINGVLAATENINNDEYVFACSIKDDNEAGQVDVNFGNGYFGTTAISSEGTNASNIGKFEYDVPTGYTALSTKGLNE